MIMSDYVIEIEHAARLLIDGVWHEHVQIEFLQPQLLALEQLVRGEYRAAQSMQNDAEDADDLMAGVGRQWETYFGPDRDRHQMQEELESRQQTLQTHEFSIGTLAAGLLQHAKQGISLIHGGLPNCPDGRLIGTSPLKDVVWQGRNQALHWEEGKVHPPVEKCFQALSALKSTFGDYNSRNLAFDVVELLEWKTFEAFRDDLLSLK